MLVSWNWLADYVRLPESVETATDQWTMSGLNLEGVESVTELSSDADTVIDLEVTSNRPDCLGHIGVARETAVLNGAGDAGVCRPTPEYAEVEPNVRTVTSVDINCPDLCDQYVARVVRGVKIGPSPHWMQDRLKAVGIAPVNNVVDCTNYVLMECGQPLHAFDFQKLSGGRILVRQAEPGEKLEAIDHKTYELSPNDCVIADEKNPVAIAGVMGGASTEIGDATTEVLIEVANFDPLTVRNTARRLSLFSDSSYRFERGVDEQQLDWASRRCCQLIVETAGGEVLEGMVLAGRLSGWEPAPIAMRFAQISRILGVDITAKQCVQILTQLGCEPVSQDENSVAVRPPSWRRDLTREADLIEEVARIFGYDRIPTDAMIPVEIALPTTEERVLSTAADVLVGAGFCEAMTLTFATETVRNLFTPRQSPEVKVEHSSRKQENILRPSVVPGLLVSRRENERRGQFDADLFEVARVFLASEADDKSAQPKVIAGVTGRSFAETRGVLDLIVRKVCRADLLGVQPSDVAQFAPGRGAELTLNGLPVGWLGELDQSVADTIDLQSKVTVFELSVDDLVACARLTPRVDEVPQFPAMTRDVNLVLDESVAWADLATLVSETAGPLLESLRFVEQYRGKGIDPGKKSYVFSIVYRAPNRTLESDEVDAAQAKVVAACVQKFAATQR